MVEKVVMPQLGESVTEGTVTNWFVKVGDRVKKYDPICEVTTDKVNAEVPSSFNGTITEIVAQEGETVPVGALICYVNSEDKTGSSTVDLKSSTTVQNNTRKNEVAFPKEEQQRLSPAVLKLAQEHQLDLSNIQGTGIGGRITRKDILETLKRMEKDQGNSSVQTFTSEKVNKEDSELVVLGDNTSPREVMVNEEDQMISVTAVRKSIADKMVQSKHNAPHAWTMVECDVTNLVRYRNQLKDKFKQKEGIHLTYLPFIIKAVVEALKEYPIINSQWADDKIIIKKSINISIAVGTEEALYVPVIKNADQKSILGLAKEVGELIAKTKDGKLTPDDMTGGTFTVNNTGAFGSILSNPIINYPQAAILSVESIVKRPVVIDNMIAIRDMMNLCLSFDHRIVDGLICGRFLQTTKENIQEFGQETKVY